jgi:hypothetical protein
MMNNDDFNRAPAPQMQPSRKPYTPNRFGNTGPGYNSYNQNSSFNNGQQHPRRRVDRFKRESLNSNDKVTRQNDLIIRLLKEIRDRLPPPPVSVIESSVTESTLQQEQGNAMDQQDVAQPSGGQQEEHLDDAGAQPDEQRPDEGNV